VIATSQPALHIVCSSAQLSLQPQVHVQIVLSYLFIFYFVLGGGEISDLICEKFPKMFFLFDKSWGTGDVRMHNFSVFSAEV
jgi:hypothetical protein